MPVATTPGNHASPSAAKIAARTTMPVRTSGFNAQLWCRQNEADERAGATPAPRRKPLSPLRRALRLRSRLHRSVDRRIAGEVDPIADELVRVAERLAAIECRLKGGGR